MPIVINSPRDGDTLACGHVLVTPEATKRLGFGGTGYAILPDESCICYDCAHARDVEALRTAEHWVAYLSADGKQIHDWPGYALMTVTRSWETESRVFGRLSHTTWIRAVDTHGAEWHGRGPGRGMYVRLTRKGLKRGGR